MEDETRKGRALTKESFPFRRLAVKFCKTSILISLLSKVLRVLSLGFRVHCDCICLTLLLSLASKLFPLFQFLGSPTRNGTALFVIYGRKHSLQRSSLHYLLFFIFLRSFPIYSFSMYCHFYSVHVSPIAICPKHLLLCVMQPLRAQEHR